MKKFSSKIILKPEFELTDPTKYFVFNFIHHDPCFAATLHSIWVTLLSIEKILSAACWGYAAKHMIFKYLCGNFLNNCNCSKEELTLFTASL